MAKFGVSRPTIRDWRMSKEELERASGEKRRRLEGGGRNVAHPEMDAIALDFVQKCRERGHAVHGPMVQSLMEAVAKDKGVDFGASSGWLTNFKSRNDLTTRRVTGFVQKLPGDHEKKVKEFRALLATTKREEKLPENVTLWNFDETPLYFDMPLVTTLDSKNKKQVLVKKALSSRKRFTAGFMISSKGEKLPPYLIFPGKRRIVRNFGPDVVCSVQEKAWMDTERFRDWVRRVVAPSRSSSSPKEILLLDSLSAHADTQAIEELRALNLIPLMIPGGCTSILQPLDVAINKPFKDRFRERYRRWMADETKHMFTAHGTMKAAKVEDVVNWVVTSWSEITKEATANSFAAAGVAVRSGEEAESDEEFLERLRRRWQTKQTSVGQVTSNVSNST